MEPFSGESYWVNDHDTVIRVYTGGQYPFLITRGSAIEAARHADAWVKNDWKHGFLKRTIIPFVILTFVLTVLIGFRDLTNVGFWILMGVFAGACLLYALLFTPSPTFSSVPNSIPVFHVGEEVEPIFIYLKPIDRDTLFREIERSPYTTEYLLDQLRIHYISQSRNLPWKLRRT